MDLGFYCPLPPGKTLIKRSAVHITGFNNFSQSWTTEQKSAAALQSAASRLPPSPLVSASAAQQIELVVTQRESVH